MKNSCGNHAGSYNEIEITSTRANDNSRLRENFNCRETRFGILNSIQVTRVTTDIICRHFDIETSFELDAKF